MIFLILTNASANHTCTQSYLNSKQKGWLIAERQRWVKEKWIKKNKINIRFLFLGWGLTSETYHCFRDCNVVFYMTSEF